MIQDLAKRVERVLQINEGVRSDNASRHHERARRRLLDGLSVSCVLLQDLLNDTAIGSVQYSPNAWGEFREMMNDGRYHEFLQVEEKMLRSAGMRADAAKKIVSALDRALHDLVEQRANSDERWRVRLADLQGQVCDAATHAGNNEQRRSFLKRAALSAAGGLVSILNQTGATAISAPPWVAVWSVSGGIWLADSAVKGALDDWIAPLR
jgi:hypothetical protein